MIPNKSNFKFQELTPITGVKPYVIRFWETEFEDIAPVTSDTGDKLYARKDVEAILRIKKLLFEDKLSIPEAKVRMRTQEPESHEAPVAQPVSTPVAAPVNEKVREQLKEALNFIQDIKLKRNW